MTQLWTFPVMIFMDSQRNRFRNKASPQIEHAESSLYSERTCQGAQMSSVFFMLTNISPSSIPPYLLSECVSY